jgi:hypothetical protein
MTDRRVVASIPLENGLILELLDESRLLAGDRWLVHLVACIQVPLTPDLLRDVPEGGRLYEDLRQENGDRLEYRADLKKHYVDEKDRERVLGEFQDIVRQEKAPYLSHPAFARRLALSRAREMTQGGSKWGRG